MTVPYRVWYANFNYYDEHLYSTLDEAIKAGKAVGFEFAVHLNHDNMTSVVVSWSPIGGLRRHYRGVR